MTKLEDSWSSWIRDGDYVKYRREDTLYYAEVAARDFAHWEYTWGSTPANPAGTAVLPGATSGPTPIEQLELTKENHLWQLIWGMRYQVYCYVQLPSDTDRHGIPTQPKPSDANRKVAHFTEMMSPYDQPSFITEHFMLRPVSIRLVLEIYNPPVNEKWLIPDFNFYINKMVLDVLGSGGIREEPVPTAAKNADILRKLYLRQVPCRPIPLDPVRAPPVAPVGE